IEAALRDLSSRLSDLERRGHDGGGAARTSIATRLDDCEQNLAFMVERLSGLDQALPGLARRDEVTAQLADLTDTVHGLEGQVAQLSQRLELGANNHADVARTTQALAQNISNVQGSLDSVLRDVVTLTANVTDLLPLTDALSGLARKDEVTAQ